MLVSHDSIFIQTWMSYTCFSIKRNFLILIAHWIYCFWKLLTWLLVILSWREWCFDYWFWVSLKFFMIQIFIFCDSLYRKDDRLTEWIFLAIKVKSNMYLSVHSTYWSAFAGHIAFSRKSVSKFLQILHSLDSISTQGAFSVFASFHRDSSFVPFSLGLSWLVTQDPALDRLKTLDVEAWQCREM